MSQALDVEVLLKDPKAALLPVLKTIHGWEQVNISSWGVISAAPQHELCAHCKVVVDRRQQRTVSVWHKFPEP